MGQARQRTQGRCGRMETGLRVVVMAAATLVSLALSTAAAEPALPSMMARDRSWYGIDRSFDGLIVPDSVTTVADGGVLAESDAVATESPASLTSDWTSAAEATDDLCWPASCDPVGLLQKCHAAHVRSGSRWIARADGLVLWRDAPPARPLIISGDGLGSPLLTARQLQSTATGGVRGSLLRIDGCTGNAWEAGYLFAGNFTAQHTLPLQAGFAYALAPPGIYGNNESIPFDSGMLSLLAQLQGAELNRHLALGPNIRWLAGFRWVQWWERFTLADTLNDGVNWVDDQYRTDCLNNLYGGQIGLDARLLSLGSLRIDSVVKAGAYYNAALQSSSYTLIDHVDPANSGSAAVTVFQSPAACSFVGEVGIAGVLPITPNVDFRVGYLGLWITGLAQPTQQLSGQQLNPAPGSTNTGTLTANGGTLVQGLTLGLEGRW